MKTEHPKYLCYNCNVEVALLPIESFDKAPDDKKMSCVKLGDWYYESQCPKCFRPIWELLSAQQPRSNPTWRAKGPKLGADTTVIHWTPAPAPVIEKNENTYAFKKRVQAHADARAWVESKLAKCTGVRVHESEYFRSAVPESIEVTSKARKAPSRPAPADNSASDAIIADLRTQLAAAKAEIAALKLASVPPVRVYGTIEAHATTGGPVKVKLLTTGPLADRIAAEKAFGLKFFQGSKKWKLHQERLKALESEAANG